MWWVAGTFAAIVVFCTLVGWWKDRAELRHVVHENDLLITQNANLRSLVDTLRARVRRSGEDGASRLFAELRDTPPLPPTGSRACRFCGDVFTEPDTHEAFYCKKRRDAKALDDAPARGGGGDGAA